MNTLEKIEQLRIGWINRFSDNKGITNPEQTKIIYTITGELYHCIHWGDEKERINEIKKLRKVWIKRYINSKMYNPTIENVITTICEELHKELKNNKNKETISADLLDFKKQAINHIQRAIKCTEIPPYNGSGVMFPIANQLKLALELLSREQIKDAPYIGLTAEQLQKSLSEFAAQIQSTANNIYPIDLGLNVLPPKEEVITVMPHGSKPIEIQVQLIEKIQIKEDLTFYSGTTRLLRDTVFKVNEIIEVVNSITGFDLLKKRDNKDKWNPK